VPGPERNRESQQAPKNERAIQGVRTSRHFFLSSLFRSFQKVLQVHPRIKRHGINEMLVVVAIDERVEVLGAGIESPTVAEAPCWKKM